MDQQGVDQALAGVRTGLEADGFKLYAHEVTDDGNVVVVLEPGSADCLDCLVPDAVLEQMVGNAVRSDFPDVANVSLMKSGFETLESH